MPEPSELRNLLADGQIAHKHKGARNELAAILWLLNQGYEVYRNVSQHGDIDLIAKRNDETLLIDVKAARSKLSDRQVAAGIHMMFEETSGGFIMEKGQAYSQALCAKCGRPIGRRRKGYCSRTCSNAVALERYREKRRAETWGRMADSYMKRENPLLEKLAKAGKIKSIESAPNG